MSTTSTWRIVAAPPTPSDPAHRDAWAVQALCDIDPGERRLHTWNAQENAHMLAINVALGYAPAGVSAGWQRRTR